MLGGVFAIVVGLICYLMIRNDLQACGAVPGRWPAAFAVIGSALAFALSWAMHTAHCQETDVVRPSELWFYYRLPYHLVLLTLLVSVTATDLKTYYILDRPNWIGLLVGIGMATVSGDLQLEHIWVDWSHEIPQLRGPYIPDWLSAHPHLHGLAWSVSGAVVGAGLTWVVQWLSGWVLGQPALGSGDVLLMAMIGSFLGWQPTLVAFAIAPILALGIGVTARLVSRRAIIPYGPFLAGGALVVLFAWRWILMAEINLTGRDTNDPREVFALRRFLGDPVSLPLVLGGALLLLLVLLGGMRWYMSYEPSADATTQKPEP